MVRQQGLAGSVQRLHRRALRAERAGGVRPARSARQAAGLSRQEAGDIMGQDIRVDGGPGHSIDRRERSGRKAQRSIHEHLAYQSACGNHDRTCALFDGRAPIEGCEVAAVALEPEEAFHRAFRYREFDVTEISMSSHMMTTARGDNDYVAIPAFISRVFRQSGIYVRTDRASPRPRTCAAGSSACRSTRSRPTSDPRNPAGRAWRPARGDRLAPGRRRGARTRRARAHRSGA